MKKNINATGMWFLRRMQKMSSMDRVTKEAVLNNAKTPLSIMKNINKRQSIFFGHAMRSKGLMDQTRMRSLKRN